MRALIFLTLIALMLAFSIWMLDWRMMLFSFSGFSEYFQPYLSPNLEPAFLWNVLKLSGETLAMAIISSLFSVVIAALLAWWADGWLKWPLKLLFNLLRSVPELLFAGLLVIAVGLGPTAGILALTLHTAGVLARLFTETLENADREPATALKLSGASSAQAFWFGLLPVVQTQWLAYSLYRSEMNIRAATVLGVVGAGGIGQQLFVALSLFQYAEASTLILAIILLVMLAEALSRALRQGRFAQAEVE